MLSSFIPDDERIVTIEDAAELRLDQDHVLRLESRPANIEGKGAVTIRDLVKNSLRMRPDRIVVGEIRDAAALDMLQAMNTGHDGSISTLHANTPRDALSRLETMVLMAGMDLPVRAIREQVSSAVDLIIQQTRLKDGTRRITAITEIVGMEGDIITTQDVFLFDYAAGVDEHGKFKGHLSPPACARGSSSGWPTTASTSTPPSSPPGAAAMSRVAARRVRDLGAVALAGSLASPRRAHAADEINIDHVEADDGTVVVLLSVDGLPGGTRRRRRASSVEVDGEPVDATAETVPRATSSGRPSSSSTPATACSGRQVRRRHGRRRRLPRAPPRDVAIGLVTFAGKVQRADRADHRSRGRRRRSRASSSQPGTSVYDAIAEAVELARQRRRAIPARALRRRRHRQRHHARGSCPTTPRTPASSSTSWRSQQSAGAGRVCRPRRRHRRPGHPRRPGSAERGLRRAG